MRMQHRSHDFTPAEVRALALALLDAVSDTRSQHLAWYIVCMSDHDFLYHCQTMALVTNLGTVDTRRVTV